MFRAQQRPRAAAADNSLYDTLGVARTATAQEIRNAFRRLAVKYHPDKPTGDKERFQQINAAHEILSDERQRRIYDAHGLAGVQQQQQRRAAGAAQGAAFEDLFAHMFGAHAHAAGTNPFADDDYAFSGGGGGGGGGGAGPRVFTFNVGSNGAGGFSFAQQMRAQEEPVLQLCDVSLEHVYARHPFVFNVRVRRRPETATGGAAAAAAAGVEVVEKTFKVTFQSWNDLKRPVTLRGKGHQSADAHVRDGDIQVRTDLKEHAHYAPCNQYDLILRHTISLEDALCGFDFDVPFIDAARTALRFTNADRPHDVVEAGAVFKCACGLPKPSVATPPTAFDPRAADYEHYGTLYVVLDVDTPHALDDAARQRLAARLRGTAADHSATTQTGARRGALVALERAPARIEAQLCADVFRRKVEERGRRRDAAATTANGSGP